MLATLKFDTLFIVIVTVFMFLTSLPCPWFQRPRTEFQITSKLLAFLAFTMVCITTIYTVDLKTDPLKGVIDILMSVLYLMQCGALLMYQLSGSEEMREIINTLQQIARDIGNRSYCINSITRITIIFFTFSKAHMFSLTITHTSFYRFTFFYVSVLSITLLCEWAILLSLIGHGFCRLKRDLKSSIGQIQTKQLQQQLVLVIVNMYRLYKEVFSRVNAFFSYMLLSIIISNVLSILTQLIKLVNIGIHEEAHKDQSIQTKIVMLESLVTLFLICALCYTVQNQVESFKYTVDKVLTYNPSKLTRHYLKSFLNEVNISDFSIRPLGLFPINLKLVKNVMGTAILFVMVMAQLREREVN